MQGNKIRLEAVYQYFKENKANYLFVRSWQSDDLLNGTLHKFYKEDDKYYLTRIGDEKHTIEIFDIDTGYAYKNSPEKVVLFFTTPEREESEYYTKNVLYITDYCDENSLDKYKYNEYGSLYKYWYLEKNGYPVLVHLHMNDFEDLVWKKKLYKGEATTNRHPRNSIPIKLDKEIDGDTHHVVTRLNIYQIYNRLMDVVENAEINAIRIKTNEISLENKIEYLIRLTKEKDIRFILVDDDNRYLQFCELYFNNSQCILKFVPTNDKIDIKDIFFDDNFIKFISCDDITYNVTYINEYNKYNIYSFNERMLK